MSCPTRPRAASQHGLAYWANAYRQFTQDEMLSHFENFKMYDLDDSGFISVDNITHVLAALDVEATGEQVKSMITEALLLSGAPNDGKLTFRNFMDCIVYDATASSINESAMMAGSWPARKGFGAAFLDAHRGEAQRLGLVHAGSARASDRPTV